MPEKSDSPYSTDSKIGSIIFRKPNPEANENNKNIIVPPIPTPIPIPPVPTPKPNPPIPTPKPNPPVPTPIPTPKPIPPVPTPIPTPPVPIPIPPPPPIPTPNPNPNPTPFHKSRARTLHIPYISFSKADQIEKADEVYGFYRSNPKSNNISHYSENKLPSNREIDNHLRSPPKSKDPQNIYDHIYPNPSSGNSYSGLDNQRKSFDLSFAVSKNKAKTIMPSLAQMPVEKQSSDIAKSKNEHKRIHNADFLIRSKNLSQPMAALNSDVKNQPSVLSGPGK